MNVAQIAQDFHHLGTIESLGFNAIDDGEVLTE